MVQKVEKALKKVCDRGYREGTRHLGVGEAVARGGDWEWGQQMVQPMVRQVEKALKKVCDRDQREAAHVVHRLA